MNGIEETGAGVKQNAILQRREQERKKKEWTLGDERKKKIAKDYSCCPDWPEVCV